MGHTCNNQFDSSGEGEQNVAQGDHAIGKQVNVTQTVSGDGNICSGTGNVTVNGIPPALFAEYAGKLAVTDSALASFFKILEEQQVPLSDLDSKLREIAAQHKELLSRLETVQSADPQVVRLKGEARQAIEAGDYAKAEELLNQAEARDMQAIEELEQAARQRRISAAASCLDNATLQRMQYRHAKAAEYWQKAAALMPESKKEERAFCLSNAGDDLTHVVARDSEALSLYEQSLSIYLEIKNKEGEGTNLNNIGTVYCAKGDNDKALPLYAQSLAISRETGDKEGEGVTVNNIGEIYRAQGDYTTALKYLEQSLSIFRELGDKAREGVTLSNIGAIHHVQGNYTTALKYLEQSLSICWEIGNKAGEADASWNIVCAYQEQDNLAKAEVYSIRAVQLAEEIGHSSLEKYREGLERIRAKLRSG